MSPPDLITQLNSALDGRYRIERELGEGGMATVYLADDVRHDRKVAVKVLKPELTAVVGAKRFLAEIRTTARLQHPHILPLFDSGRADAFLFFVMPYVEGENLRDTLRANGPLPVDQAVRIALEVADALQAAHDRGVTHRDIKPANVMLAGGHALVMDFGIARSLDREESIELTQVGSSVGTPTYMSPEQATGDHEVDGRTDLYALGCLLYELLTGEPPYTGSSFHSILAKKLTQRPTPVSALRPNVPRSVDEALDTALQPLPADRQPSMDAFAQALRAYSATTGAENGSTAHPTRSAVAQSVAVLPLRNVGSDEEGEFFAEGVTDDIIAHLARIRQLKVISRTSSMRFKGSELGLPQIADELGVSHILEGSVRKLGDRLRVTTQLVHAASDEHLWSEVYDRGWADVFEVQGDIARQVAEALTQNLTRHEKAALERVPTADLEAYRLFLEGRRSYAALEIPESVVAFEAATERDPGYADAFAALAQSWFYMGEGYYGTRPREALRKVLASAERALELNPDNAEAMAILGCAKYTHDLDLVEGPALIQRAVDLGHSTAVPHRWQAVMYNMMGRHDDALVAMKAGLQYDPLSLLIQSNHAAMLHFARRHEESAERVKQLRELYGLNHMAFSEGVARVAMGQTAEAVPLFRMCADALGGVPDGFPLALHFLAYGLASNGEEQEARDVLAALEKREESEYIWPMGFAFGLLALGDREGALSRIEQSFEDRAGLIFINDWAFEPLRGEPRYDAVRAALVP